MANEAETAVAFVGAVLAECRRLPFRSTTIFVVVDTTSHDDTRDRLTASAAQFPELRVVWAPENTCVADAYLRGYREALAAGCDWVLEIDAGFSHRPGDIPKFVEAMVGGAECAFGSRFMPGGRNLAARRRRIVSRCGTLLSNLALGTTLTDMTSGYQLFSRPALEHVLASGIRSHGPFFQTEMKWHCRSFRTAEVPIEYSGASHRVGRRAITESLVNLSGLFVRRLTGAL